MACVFGSLRLTSAERSVRAPVGVQYDDWTIELKEQCDLALDETIGRDGTVAQKQHILNGTRFLLKSIQFVAYLYLCGFVCCHERC
jgi:hypothetical protein